MSRGFEYMGGAMGERRTEDRIRATVPLEGSTVITMLNETGMVFGESIDASTGAGIQPVSVEIGEEIRAYVGPEDDLIVPDFTVKHRAEMGTDAPIIKGALVTTEQGRHLFVDPAGVDAMLGGDTTRLVDTFVASGRVASVEFGGFTDPWGKSHSFIEILDSLVAIIRGSAQRGLSRERARGAYQRHLRSLAD